MGEVWSAIHTLSVSSLLAYKQRTDECRTRTSQSCERVMLTLPVFYCAVAPARLERAADIVICTPICSSKQLPCVVVKPPAWSRTSSWTLWTESDLWSYPDRPRAEDAYHVYRPVWAWLSACHCSLQPRCVLSQMLNCLLFEECNIMVMYWFINRVDKFTPTSC